MIERVALIGSGNIAHWMAFALHRAGVTITQVYSRQISHAVELASQYQAEAIDDIGNLHPDSDLYIFSVSDDAYDPLLKQLTFRLPMAVHTAGSRPIWILEPYTDECGVLYPFQSLSKNMDFDGVEVPLCLETKGENMEKELFALAQRMSSSVRFMPVEQRMELHKAAVFACNFTNAMYAIAYDMMQRCGIDWQLILPLLQNTLDKVKTMNPHDAQTGPAKRGDNLTLRQHLETILERDLRSIYLVMTEYIMQH